MSRYLLFLCLTICSVLSVHPTIQVPVHKHLKKVEQGQMYLVNNPLRVGIVQFPSPSNHENLYDYSKPRIEVVHDILANIGYHYTYTIDTQSILMEALEVGELDVIFGMPKNNDVHPQMLYSLPYEDIVDETKQSSETSRVYLMACASMKHYPLIRHINREVLKQNSGYLIGYLQKQWFGVTVYLHQYLRLQNILSQVFITCIVAAIFLIFIFVRVGYLSIESRNKTRYLHALFNKFPVPVYILEKLGGNIRYAYLNDVAKSKQFAIREECEEKAMDQHKKRLLNACKLAVTTRETVSFVDRRIAESPYTVYTSPCTFQGETRIIKTVVDTKELLFLKEIAEENSKQKDEFLANISHEVRTPLNSILGFCQLLPEMSNEEASEALDIIEKKSKQLHKLIDDILILSKLESHEIQINHTDISNAEWLPSVVERVHEELDSPSSVPVYCDQGTFFSSVSIDKELAYIVLSNLLQNAIKFTTTGTIHIGCACIPNYIVYYIQDTGKGMTEEECFKIFNRFVKLDTFTQGTGLGLPIVRRVVDILSGHLGMYSVPAQGTTCYFCYPNIGKFADLELPSAPELIHLKDAVWIGSSPKV